MASMMEEEEEDGAKVEDSVAAEDVILQSAVTDQEQVELQFWMALVLYFAGGKFGNGCPSGPSGHRRLSTT